MVWDLKKIEFTLYNPKNFIDKLKLIHILPWTYYFCDLYVLAPTVFYAKYFTKAFRVPLYKIIKAAYPRNDVFFVSEDELKYYLIENKDFEFFEKILRLKKSGSKLILYAPTFRDRRRNIDIFKEANLDIDLLNRILMKNNAYLILKLHPAEKGHLTDIKKYKRFLVALSDMGIYPILPYVDLLITDYSSIFADYLYTGSLIIFFTFDFDDYVTKR